MDVVDLKIITHQAVEVGSVGGEDLIDQVIANCFRLPVACSLPHQQNQVDDVAK